MSTTSIAELREIVAELSRSQMKTDRQMAETDRRMEETHRELKKFIGSVGSEWGHLVESLTRPSCLGQLREAGIDVTQMAGDTMSQRPGFEQEWDVLLVDGAELVAVEVKSRFRPADLDRVEEKLAKFKKAFPQYDGYRVYGAVAAIKFDAGLERRAPKRGLFVFQPSGEVMKLVNEKGFKPKAY